MLRESLGQTGGAVMILSNRYHVDSVIQDVWKQWTLHGLLRDAYRKHAVDGIYGAMLLTMHLGDVESIL